MSNKVEGLIEAIANRHIEEQSLILEQEGAKLTVNDIVRSGYEHWVELMGIYKATGKRDGYAYLVEVFRKELGSTASVETVRKAFSAIRLERGERVFKKNGAPVSNKRWGKS